MLDAEAPQSVVAEGIPVVHLVVDGERGRLTLRCEVSADVSSSELERLDLLDVRYAATDGRWIEVSTDQPDLFPFFVAFSGTVADEVQLEGASVRAALQRSLRLFRRLVRDTSLLSPERQLGLFGELWVLDRLVRAYGETAIDAWLGPNAEAHDFRRGDAELEVKSTRRQYRHHRINGLDQLEGSPGADLYLLSLQFTAAGPGGVGASLKDSIQGLRTRLLEFGQEGLLDAVLVDRFDLRPETEHRYNDRLKLRTEPRLIHIGRDTPRLLRDDVLAVRRPSMQRILDIDYLLDCEGLGAPDGTREFMAVIP